MVSLLIIAPVESLQKEINQTVQSFKGKPGIYVSLNKTHKSTQDILKKEGISIENLFFIDCVTSEKIIPDVLNIPPTQLGQLSYAILSFIKELEGKKFLLIDALSTLLIYNEENKVAQFVKEITEYASENNVEVIALSPKTKGEELLNKIFNFFDKVKKDKK
jgi:archaellum biogenesis ATPase FlaH